MSSTTDNNLSPIETEPTWIPEGYVVVMGPDGKEYVVPEFFIPALQQNLEGNEKKGKLEIDKAAGTVSTFQLSEILRWFNGRTYWVLSQWRKRQWPNSQSACRWVFISACRRVISYRHADEFISACRWVILYRLDFLSLCLCCYWWIYFFKTLARFVNILVHHLVWLERGW